MDAKRARTLPAAEESDGSHEEEEEEGKEREEKGGGADADCGGGGVYCDGDDDDEEEEENKDAIKKLKEASKAAGWRFKGSPYLHRLVRYSKEDIEIEGSVIAWKSREESNFISGSGETGERPGVSHGAACELAAGEGVTPWEERRGLREPMEGALQQVADGGEAGAEPPLSRGRGGARAAPRLCSCRGAAPLLLLARAPPSAIL